MRKLFLVISLLIYQSSLAHSPSTDWLMDHQAFENARWLGKPSYFLQGPSELYLSFNIEPDRLKHWLEELSGHRTVSLDGQTVRITERRGSAMRALARRYLQREFTQLGYTVTEQNYGQGSNFIAERVGSEPSRVLVVSAHYDSVGNAGANDDGTGIVAMLAIAEALMSIPLKATLRFVGFDQEEIGLVGSAAYVQALPASETLIGDIQMEMMGTNARNDGAFHVMDCDRADSIPLSQHIMNAIVSLNLPLNRVAACTNRSDHAKFWQRNLPAVVLSENFFGGDSDPCYHRSCDRADARLNYQYMANIVTAVTSAVEVLVTR